MEFIWMEFIELLRLADLMTLILICLVRSISMESKPSFQISSKVDVVLHLDSYRSVGFKLGVMIDS